MLLAYRRPFTFSGRSTRTELLGYLIISWVLTTIAFYALLLTLPGPEFFVVSITAIRFLLWLPMPALAIRRAHDIGRPWYWALALLIPTLLAWVGRDALDQIPELIQFMLALNIVGLIILFWKPTDEANEYGPNPRLEGDEVFVSGA